MALYTNFAVEAELQNAVAAIADRLASAPLSVEGITVAMDRVDTFEKDGMWYFFAEPGFSNGWHRVPQLNTLEAFAAIREEFFTRLRGSSGFRRALFGHEALDFLADSPDDYRYFGLPHMVVREDLVRDRSFLARCSRFSDGYLRVGDETKTA